MVHESGFNWTKCIMALQCNISRLSLRESSAIFAERKATMADTQNAECYNGLVFSDRFVETQQDPCDGRPAGMFFVEFGQHLQLVVLRKAGQ